MAEKCGARGEEDNVSSAGTGMSCVQTYRDIELRACTVLYHLRKLFRFALALLTSHLGGLVVPI